MPRASRCAVSIVSMATKGFAEIFLEDVFVADADVIGEVNQGWSVAMATTGSERGLEPSESPGRFVATAARLIDLYHRYRDRSDPVLRDEVIQAWMDAQVYRWFTFQTVTRMVQGESIGPDSSMNKVFWSEMDVRTHETALAIVGEALELDEGSDSAIDGGHWMKGFQFALAGPDLRGYQRNPTQHHCRARPRSSAEIVSCVLPSPTIRRCCATRCVKSCSASVPPRSFAPLGKGIPEGARAVWDTLAETGVIGMTASEEAGGMAMSELDLVLPLEEAGYAALPWSHCRHGGCRGFRFSRRPEPTAQKERWLGPAVAGKARIVVSLGDQSIVAHAVSADVLIAEQGWGGVLRPAGRGFDQRRALGRPRPRARSRVVRGRCAVSDATRRRHDRAIHARPGARCVGHGGSADRAQPSHARHGGPVREGSRAVRQADRRAASDQAPARQRAHRAEFARPTVYRAGWSMATSAPDADINVSLAKIYAGQAAKFVAKEALQVHGAIGYTIECDLHMWMKRAWALAAVHGDAAYHRERVGRHIL